MNSRYALPFRPQSPTARRWRVLGKLAALTLAETLVFGLHAAAVILLALAASSANAVTLDEVGAGELLFKTDTQGVWNPAMQLGTKVDLNISGLVAEVTVEQRFKNTSGDWVEGNYVFPLPENAAVNAMEMHIGERVIVGEIHEKQTARKIYAEAKQQGKRTALVEQRRPNMFASKVANIGPDEEISVRITYLEKVSYQHGRFSIRFPMTITPRYIPGKPIAGSTPNGFSEELAQTELSVNPHHGWSLPTDQVPDAHEITPLLQPRPASRNQPVNPIEITARIDAGLELGDVASSYHAIRIIPQQRIYSVSLADGPVSMDRDFELTWAPIPSAAPQAAVFTEEIAGERYALVMVVPPERRPTARRIKREAIFVVDTSGSMGGASIKQARAALDIALGTLQPDDRFNIIEFNDSPTQLFPRARLASGAYLYEAGAFVEQLEANGGTEIASAISAALDNQDELPADILRQVIFITDGSVGNEDALFKMIDRKLGASRLFTVGIGSAPNSYFMRKAAEFGRGTFTYIGSIDEVQDKMAELFTQLESPVLRNIDVSWPGKTQSFPNPVPDLYAGQPLITTAKLGSGTGYKDSAIRISGAGPNGDWKQLFRLDNNKQHAGVATLWARDRITNLSDAIIREGESDDLRNEIISVALLHKLVSRYTSFVAVDKTPVRPVSEKLSKQNVPNARPAGQTHQPFAYPQTATSTVEQMWLGILSLALAAQVWWLRRREPGKPGRRHA